MNGDCPRPHRSDLRSAAAGDLPESRDTERALAICRLLLMICLWSVVVFAAEAQAQQTQSNLTKAIHPVEFKGSISSCFTATCHGSSSADGPAWSRSALVWLNDDPHANAFATLHSKWSAEIVRKLTGASLTSANKNAYDKYLNDNCLSCHASAGQAEGQRVLGVTCQACHGPTSAWDESHWKSGIVASSEPGSAANARIKLSDLKTRISTCIDCHIGRIAAGVEKREVNHDLIAAGHPPLQFEFASHWQRMPAHWDNARDEHRYGESAQLVNWQAGVVLSAAARVQLLASRLSQTTLDPSISKSAFAKSSFANPVNSNPASILANWPELAEFNCYDCHHNLQPSGWRSAGPAAGGVKVRWNSWSRESLSLLVDSVPVGERTQIMQVIQHVNELSIAVESSSFNPTEVLSQASRVGNDLELLYRPLVEQKLQHLDRSRLIKNWLERKSGAANWDAARNWFWAVGAASKTLHLEEVSRELSKLERDVLNASHDIDLDSHASANGSRMTSPSGFSPQAFELGRLRLLEFFSQESQR